jgi:CheY-like chemotaxis protein
METRKPRISAPITSPARMLVVDDDREICDLVGELFAGQSDIQVACCTDPRDALEQLQYRPVDVVLTDLFMGRYSGMDILESSREFHPDAVVTRRPPRPIFRKSYSWRFRRSPPSSLPTSPSCSSPRPGS